MSYLVKYVRRDDMPDHEKYRQVIVNTTEALHHYLSSQFWPSDIGCFSVTTIKED